MKASFFEPIRYVPPQKMPAQWPLPPGFYDPEVGMQTFQGTIERLQFVEELGFDWVSFSEHHYGARILTPSPIVMAAHMAAHLHNVKIAVLGPIISLNNPVRVAEEFAMLDNLTQGRLVVGLLRGTTNEYLVFDVKPEEAREKTTEGMELILKAWTEPHPFGWQGRHFRYRTVSVWPRPLQQPHPPTFALGTSKEAGAFAARNRIGLGVSYGPFEVMGKVTAYYREQCGKRGWEPEPDQIIFRANIVLSETDAQAQQAMEAYPARAPFSLADGVASALLALDTRNIAGEARPASINRALPINFFGGPDTVVDQIRRCREVIGAGVIDLGFNTPGTTDPDALLDALDLFGRAVLPHIRDI